MVDVVKNNRFFLSFNLEDSCINEIIAIQNKINYAESSKLISKKNLHMTLLFLGKVDESKLQILENIETDIENLNLELEPIIFDKTFYWRSAKVSGLSASKVPDFLNILYDFFKDKLLLTAEDKKIKPHITLARKVIKNPKYIMRFEPIELNIKELYLMQSIFSENKPIEYKVIKKYQLRS